MERSIANFFLGVISVLSGAGKVFPFNESSASSAGGTLQLALLVTILRPKKPKKPFITGPTCRC
eukprot:6929604-Ditylum_brightwellii.AAC.1